MASFAAKCGGSNKNSSVRTPDEIAVDDLLRSKVREDITKQSQVSTNGLRAIDMLIDAVKLKVTLSGTVATDAAREEAIRVAGQSEVERNGKKFKATEVDASNLKVKP
jgi:hypothetical protein